jgi:hypothetical protein
LIRMWQRAAEWRHRDAEVCGSAPLDLHRPAENRTRRRQTLRDQLHERRKRGEHLVVIEPYRISVHANHVPAGAIEDLDATASIDDEQTRGKAFDDVATQLL